MKIISSRCVENMGFSFDSYDSVIYEKIRTGAKYDIAKKGFEQAKDSLKSCEGEECKALRLTMQNNIKDSLLQTVEIAENKLAQIKDKLAESEMLTADEDKDARDSQKLSCHYSGSNNNSFAAS